MLVLGQEQSPDFLPVQLTFVKDRKTTLAFLRAADHPAMRGLNDDDMRWWAGSGEQGRADDHYVSIGIYRKPTRGNFLPLVDCGTGDGLLESPMMESTTASPTAQAEAASSSARCRWWRNSTSRRRRA